MVLPDLSPRRRESTSEYIARRLRDAIVAGQLSPGVQLGEAELAEQFAVSRGPVREALQQLTSEGLAQARLHRGVFVTELTLDDALDVYRARLAIERGAVELLFAEGRTGEAADALTAAVDALRRAAQRGDAGAVSDADLAFHETLVAYAGSPRLSRAMHTLVAETRMCLGALESTYPDAMTQVAEHENLRDALATRPRETVTEMWAEHVDDAVERLTTKWRS